MSISDPRPFRFRPYHWARQILRVTGRSLARLWGRNVMLYTGGVSFYALLAAFPTLALLIGVYSLLLTPDDAIAQADAMARILPSSAADLFRSELERLAHAPIRIVSAQSGVALLISLYAAQRGFKALIAGLSFIHEEKGDRGFVGVNVLALVVLLAAFGLVGLLSAAFLTVRVLASTFQVPRDHGAHWYSNEWVWASIGISLGMSLVYRFAMSSRRVAWRAAVLGGIAAAGLTLAASWASAIYAKQFSHFGATYGSIAAVVVVLIWLSWSVNAVFFGAALATEVQLSLRGARAEPKVKPAAALEP
jgi:membrane protein